MNNLQAVAQEYDEIQRKHRENEYADLAGEEPPYPELLHEHRWNADDFCDECGADGRA